MKKLGGARGRWLSAGVAAVALAGCSAGNDGKPVRSAAVTSRPITYAQGGAVSSLGLSRAQVVAKLGPPAQDLAAAPGCIYYRITDQRESVWEFCFKKGRLASASAFQP
jgi:hypothetical protein